MKKTISSIIILALLVGIFSAIPVFAEDEATITITLDKTEAKVNDIINATIHLENMTTSNVIIPLHFNPSVLNVVNASDEKVISGLKTAAAMRNGTLGVTTGEALEVGNWNGGILDNLYFPYLYNENGFFRMLFSRDSEKAIIKETLITVRFKVIAEGNADIRFATSADSHYDSISKNGAAYIMNFPSILGDDGEIIDFSPTTVDAKQITQPLIVSGTNTTTPTPTPDTGRPTRPSGDGGGGGGFTPTVPQITPPVEGNTITYVVEESLIEDYMSRASVETNSSMNIPISGDAAEFIIKVPIASVKKMLNALVMDIVFETPIGVIGFHNYTIIQQSQENSEYAILRLSGALTSGLSVDQAPAEGLVIGFNTDQLGTVALKENQPVMQSRFDGTHLIFEAVSGSYVKVTIPLEFYDVSTEHWAYGYIQSLVTKTVLNGMNETTFEPDSNVTREQFAKILVSAMELLDPTAECDFNDVSKDDWFYPYVASAAKAGIIQGYEDGSFGVQKNITRQEMAVMVSRTGLRFPFYQAPTEFVDNDQIADWAEQAVQSMQMALIIDGFEDFTFRPAENATRAQAAKIIFGVLGVF